MKAHLHRFHLLDFLFIGLLDGGVIAFSLRERNVTIIDKFLLDLTRFIITICINCHGAAGVVIFSGGARCDLEVLSSVLWGISSDQILLGCTDAWLHDLLLMFFIVWTRLNFIPTFVDQGRCLRPQFSLCHMMILCKISPNKY